MELEVGQIITQIISFLIMVWVLKRYAWKPLIGVLDKRRETIISEFASIEKQKNEASALAEEYKQKLDQIESVALEKKQDAIREGKKIALEIQDKAHLEAKAIVQKAKDDLQKEILKAKEQLKDEMVDLVFLATEKVLQTDLGKEKQRDLVKEFLEKVGSK